MARTKKTATNALKQAPSKPASSKEARQAKAKKAAAKRLDAQMVADAEEAAAEGCEGAVPMEQTEAFGDDHDTEVDPEPSPQKKPRREEEEKYERILARKLPFLTDTMLSTMVGKDGVTTPKQFILKEMRKRALVQGRLSTKFWEDFYKQFDLGTEIIKQLPKPPKNMKVDQVLLECIDASQDDNPVCRDPTNLCLYLSECKRLNQRSLYGVIGAMQVGPKMSSNHASRIQNAVADYMGRTQAHIEFEAYFKVVRLQLEVAVRDAYEASVDTSIRIKSFLKRRRAAISLFSSAECIDALLSVVGSDYGAVADRVKEFMDDSLLGRCMFKGVWLECSRSLYKVQLAKNLEDLEREDFAVERLDQFFDLMKGFERRLRGEGHVRGRNTVVAEINYLGCQMQFPMYWAADEGYFACWARIKTILSNTGQVVPMPWEKILNEDRRLQDVPTELKLPAAVIAHLENYRETVLAMFPRPNPTMADIIKAMKKNEADLVDQHRSAAIDIHFLEHHAEEEHINMVNAKVLEACPSPSEDFELEVVVTKLRAVRASSLVAAGGGAFDDEIDGIIDRVEALQAMHPPKPNEMAKFTSLTKMVFKKCENAVRIEPKQCWGKAGLALADLRGPAAMKEGFKVIGDMIAQDGSPVVTDDLKLFKMFSWMLPPPERDVLKTWYHKLLARADQDKGMKMLSDAGASVGLLVPVSGSTAKAGGQSKTSSSNASSSTAMPEPSGRGNAKKTGMSTKSKSTLQIIFG